ncbi:MAG TPA: glutathione S-transferase family protein [Polyangiaceae bacterium]|jgi:RNA polymerase-associated protein|nr:glutathione S-transferase family protein [Polyangiaceae bacterium]
MKLYQVAGCPFAHRARIVLEEKKLPYEVAYYEPRSRPAELAAISPDARSPTLLDDDGKTRVWDSLVVIEYLEERYPDVALMPRDAAARARARLLMREVDAKLLPAMGPIVEEVVHKAAGPRDEGKVQAGITQFRQALVPWQARLDHQAFLLGDMFTLADIALFTPTAAMVRLIGESGEIPEALTIVRAWRDRIAARPSTAY